MELILEVENKANLLAKLCVTSVPRSLDETENLIKVAKLLLRSPQPEPFMLRGEGWIGLSDDVRKAVNIGTEFSEEKKRLSKYYTDEIYNLDLEGILSRKEKYGSSISKIFKPGLWYKFWKDYSALKNVSVGEPKEEFSEIISNLNLKLAIKVRDFGRWLDENDEKCRKLFGKFWNGRDTDWRKIREVVSWVNEFVKTIETRGSNEDLIKLACDREMDTEQISDSLDELVSSLTKLRDNWRSLKEVLNFDESVLKEGTFESSSFHSLHEKIDSWIEGYETIADWVDFMSAKQECEEIGLGEFLKSAFENSVNPDELIPVFTKG